MATLTEGARPQEFILSEANASRSRENAILTSGQDISVGELLALSGGKLVTWNGGTDTACVGLSLYAHDVSADTYISYLARDAEVNFQLVVYPEGTGTIAKSALRAIGIIPRDYTP